MRQIVIIIAAIISVTIAFSSCNLMSGKKYKEAVAQADKYFGEKDYESAKTFYAKAQEFDPDDTYPAERIEEIEKILKAQSISVQYKQNIAEADKLLKQEAYNEARDAYTKASKIKANENYPKEQISKIDVILAEIKEQQEFLANPYHIVIGCFAVEANATKLNEKLLNEGYKSRIIPMYSGKYHAVTINSFAGNTAAYNDLNSIKEKFQDGAWVYKN